MSVRDLLTLCLRSSRHSICNNDASLRLTYLKSHTKRPSSKSDHNHKIQDDVEANESLPVSSNRVADSIPIKLSTTHISSFCNRRTRSLSHIAVLAKQTNTSNSPTTKVEREDIRLQADMGQSHLVSSMFMIASTENSFSN